MARTVRARQMLAFAFLFLYTFVGLMAVSQPTVLWAFVLIVPLHLVYHRSIPARVRGSKII